MDWQPQTKRSAPPAPLRRTVRARRSGKAVSPDDDEDDWLFGDGPPARVHPTPVKLTCALDVASSKVTTVTPSSIAPAAEPAAVALKSIETPATVEQGGRVLNFHPSDPLARYVPLRVRRVPSDEDWLMNKLVPNEA